MLITIHKSRKKAVAVTVIGFALGIGGALLLIYEQQAVTGWLFILAALFTLIYGLGSMFDGRSYLILTEQGITEPFSIREEIDWDAILQADDFYYRGQYVVRLLLERGYKPDLLRPTWFWRFDRIYAQEGLKAVYIRTSGLEMNSMRLTALIRRMIAADAAQREEILRSLDKRG